MSRLAQLQKIALAVALAGLGVLAAGAILDPTRAFTNLLVGALLVMGFATGAMVWLCLLAVANAGWAAVLKRILEGFGAFVPIGALLILATTPGLRAVYAWARPGAGEDPVIAANAVFLNPTFFVIRMAVIQSHRHRADTSPEQPFCSSLRLIWRVFLKNVLYSLSTVQVTRRGVQGNEWPLKKFQISFVASSGDASEKRPAPPGQA